MDTLVHPSARGFLTAEEFARLPEPANGGKQELVRGEVVTLPPPGFLHGIVTINIATLLKAFAKQHGLGRITTESGVVTENAPDSVRGPDIAFWSYARLPAHQVPVVYPDVAPDLCVEVRSPSNANESLIRKAKEYLAGGVRTVWIVDPALRTVSIIRDPDGDRVLGKDATIDGGDVLPGFTARVAEFFE